MPDNKDANRLEGNKESMRGGYSPCRQGRPDSRKVAGLTDNGTVLLGTGIKAIQPESYPVSEQASLSDKQPQPRQGRKPSVDLLIS